MIGILGSVVQSNVFLWVGVTFGGLAIVVAIIGTYCVVMQWRGRKFSDDLEAIRKKAACPIYGLDDVVEV
jgi:hypothetical protein